MEKLKEKFPILKPQGSIRRQIFEFYRSAILDGRFSEGALLPSARNLAETLGVSEANVHYAMAKLAQEGWIERLPKRGSLVIPRRKMRHVAFLMSGLYTRRGERFTQPLLCCIEAELKARGIESCQVIYDSGSGEGLETLKRYIASRAVDGVIARDLPDDLAIALDRLPVPYVAMGGRRSIHSVCFFNEKIATLMVQALVQQGVREAGVLWPGKVHDPFLGQLRRAAAAEGLRLKKQAFFQAEIYGKEVIDMDDFAWRGLHYLLQKTSVTGAMLFSDDLIAGVTMACYAAGLQIPLDFKLAIHGTEENRTLMPFGAAFVMQHASEMARKLVEQLCNLAIGQQTNVTPLDGAIELVPATSVPLLAHR